MKYTMASGQVLQVIYHVPFLWTIGFIWASQSYTTP